MFVCDKPANRMQAFKIHEQIIADYIDYLKSFNIIRDERIRKVVDGAF